jgi:hypothetical protein
MVAKLPTLNPLILRSSTGSAPEPSSCVLTAELSTAFSLSRLGDVDSVGGMAAFSEEFADCMAGSAYLGNLFKCGNGVIQGR